VIGQPQASEYVGKTMGMLNNFFTATEKTGTVGLLPHKTIDENAYQI